MGNYGQSKENLLKSINTVLAPCWLNPELVNYGSGLIVLEKFKICFLYKIINSPNVLFLLKYCK